MKILFITRRFYPNGDASGAVVGNLCLALKKKGAFVSVIALTPNKDDSEYKNWNGIDVKNIYIPEIKERQQIKKEWKDAHLKYSVTLAKKAYYKIARKTVSLYKNLDIEPTLYKSYKRILENKAYFKGFDICVITMMPHELVLAAVKAKFNLPFVIYQLDTYWNNDFFNDGNSDKRREFEFDAVDLSAFVLTTPLIYNIDKEYRPDLINKIVPAEFPLITDLSDDIEEIEWDGKCHCVFVGNLYTKIRPPEKVVHFISVIRNKDIVFDFYGNRQNLIAESPDYSEAEEMIRLWGIVPSYEAEQKRKSADILVNIDNTSVAQVPSKVFEYMCTGKPLINFYFNENSICLEYLKMYPLCLNINLNTENDNDFKRKFEEFCRQSKGKKVPFEEIKMIFEKCTPEYVAEQFLEAYNRFQNNE